MANIVLVGFMCTGKTQVGKRLAAALGARFVDSDEILQERAGKSIEHIFAEQGENHFRQLERGVIAHLSTKSGLVIAAGGGALEDRRNLADLRRCGTLICLSASPSEILRRAKKGPVRPLLQVSDPLARIKELLTRRAQQYAKADYHIDTTGLSPGRAAAKILRLLSVVPVNLGDRSYEIIIGRGLLTSAGEHIRRLGRYEQLVVVSEARVWDHHGKALTAGLPKHKKVILPAMEDQERLKSFRFAESLYDELVRLGTQRDSLLLAFGGGTIGDLVGFVASTYMRGIDFLQIPTTLLAQVDSSIGGKVGINHPRAKNLIGAFWQPRLVLADLHCLDTLPRQQIRNGLAEVIKHALLGDARLFRYLEEHTEEVMRLYPPTLHHLLWRNCQIKSAIVSQDEKETGLRSLLNLGHTFAHALEAAANYRGLSHGEAVSIGLALAGRLACKIGIFADSALKRLLALLQAYHLPTQVPPIPISSILFPMRADKKRRGGRLRFVLPVRIGKARLVSDIPAAVVREVLAKGKGVGSSVRNMNPKGAKRHG